jgi:hypothetical protein
MEETILSWNVPNWITVLLMVGIGFGIIGFVSSHVKQSKGS